MHQISEIRDRFCTTNVGGTLLLKVCSFLENHRAQILDVEVDRLRVRVGHSRLQRLFYHCPNVKPAEISLVIFRDQVDGLDEDVRFRLPGRSCSQIDVTISPQSKSWRPEEFRQFARRLMWSMRAHFVAPS